MATFPILDMGISSGTHSMMLTLFFDASSMRLLPMEEVQYEVHRQERCRQTLHSYQRFYSEFIIILMN